MAGDGLATYNASKRIVAEWCHMATWIRVSIGSGDGLLLDGKLSPESMLTYHQRDSVAFIQLDLLDQDINPQVVFEMYICEIKATSPRGQCFNTRAVIYIIWSYTFRVAGKVIECKNYDA